MNIRELVREKKSKKRLRVQRRCKVRKIGRKFKNEGRENEQTSNIEKGREGRIEKERGKNRKMREGKNRKREGGKNKKGEGKE